MIMLYDNLLIRILMECSFANLFWINSPQFQRCINKEIGDTALTINVASRRTL